MKTFFHTFLVVFFLSLIVLYNFGLVDIRFEEIRYLLGAISSQEDASNTLGIVAKYELIKRRMTEGEDNMSNFQLEARIQALTSREDDKNRRHTLNYRLYLVPIQYVVNGIRLLLGKPIIQPTEDDKIYSVLEIGYFWERNRKYHEALKIYEDVLKTGGVVPEIKSAVMVHKAFCISMLGNYGDAKLIYEQVISLYPNTDAGVLAWKLLDFIQSMERSRTQLEQKKMPELEKARQFYLVMDFRNAIRNYSLFLERDVPVAESSEARYFKGRSHEELGETEEAVDEYRTVIKIDKTKQWAKKANRRLLMIGSFYEQQKNITQEAKRQLDAYQDQKFFDNVQQYAQLVSQSSLRKELMRDDGSAQQQPIRDSLLNAILNIGDLDLTGEKSAAEQQKKLDSIRTTLIEKGAVGKAEMKALERWQAVMQNPYRRPSVLKEAIDGYANELKYIYNKRLRSGIKLSGKMLVQISIQPDGRVATARVLQSTMGDQTFEESITDRICSWKFRAVPDSVGRLDIKYPFEFYEEE
ncbi:MAG: TonB family protein, partial [Chitinispirillaceae bacterium]|nr:TonB family protein [Chitinispirillaceae bacterium]